MPQAVDVEGRSGRAGHPLAGRGPRSAPFSIAGTAERVVLSRYAIAAQQDGSFPCSYVVDSLWQYFSTSIALAEAMDPGLRAVVAETSNDMPRSGVWHA